MYRLPNPLNQTVDLLRHPDAFVGRPQVWRFVYRYLRWEAGVRLGPAVGDPEPGLTVILLSYSRVRNMSPIIRSLLRVRAVKRVLVSNNHPEVRLEDWVSVRDDRVAILNQPAHTPPGVRFSLAVEQPGEYFLTIDDDVFLTPPQVVALFDRLRADPRAPHGIQGEYFTGDTATANAMSPGGPFAAGIAGQDCQVHVLNRVYAFTRQHLIELMRLAALLGVDVGRVRNGEDVLLSFAGSTYPFVWDLGDVLSCPSSSRIGTGAYVTLKNFASERASLFQRLREAKDSLPELVGRE